MWGREMRAGLVFVVIALLVGGGFREWKRSHKERFQNLVSALEAGDAARIGIESAGRGTASSAESTEAGGGPNGGGARRGSSSRPISRSVPVAMLNPDRADEEQLTRLPGIGPALAARIVAERNSHGPFRAPEALLRVPGIGPRTLERIRGYLMFETPAERESLGSF